MLPNQIVQSFTIIRDWIDANSDLVTSAATIVIAFFTFTLWWATYKMMKVVRGQSGDLKTSIAVAQKAADAAKKSADALPAIERAYLFVKVKFGGDLLDHRDIDIVVSNYGKTPAILMNRDICIQTFENNILPECGFPYPERSDPEGAVVISSGNDWIQHYPISNDIFQKTIRDSLGLICMGRIRYEDIFDNLHETGFYWKYNHRIKSFIPILDPKRNYHK